MKPQFKILSGIPTSGKSTYCNKYKDDFAILSRDGIREVLYGKRYKQNNESERRITKVFNNALNSLLGDGKNIIIDNTNVKEAYINSFLKTIEQYPDYDVEIIFFDIPLWKAKYRNIIRYTKTGKWIPNKVMNAMYNSYIQIDRLKYGKIYKLNNNE